MVDVSSVMCLLCVHPSVCPSFHHLSISLSSIIIYIYVFIISIYTSVSLFCHLPSSLNTATAPTDMWHQELREIR